MSQPTVCAICLTADRPEYARRAVEAFRAQTYPEKRLLTYDSGEVGLLWDYDPLIDHHRYSRGGMAAPAIGDLRNWANEETSADILIHWDDDDWSHPNRIAEQVALLQSSGADCVGYREMLFHPVRASYGEAWLFTNPDPRYALGTSLCYWRKTWERKPFEATSDGEDAKFITGLNCVGVSAVPPPRMIARIHAGNTSNQYAPHLLDISNRVKGGPWRRVPEWDDYTRSIMEAA